MNKKKINIEHNYGDFEYKMSRTMAKEYLAKQKCSPNSKEGQKYLCEIVNNNFGIKGNCTSVIID